MSIVTIQYAFYNPRNPKCRACEDWEPLYDSKTIPEKEKRFYACWGKCQNKDTKVRSRIREDNDKACIQFTKFKD